MVTQEQRNARSCNNNHKPKRIIFVNQLNQLIYVNHDIEFSLSLASTQKLKERLNFFEKYGKKWTLSTWERKQAPLICAAIGSSDWHYFNSLDNFKTPKLPQFFFNLIVMLYIFFTFTFFPYLAFFLFFFFFLSSHFSLYPQEKLLYTPGAIWIHILGLPSNTHM